MRIIKTIEEDAGYDREKTVTLFKNKYGIFQFENNPSLGINEKSLHKWNDNVGWVYISNKIENFDEAKDLIEEMFNGPFLEKKIEEPQEFLVSNDSSFSNEEVMTIVNIIEKALKEWRLFPGITEEKQECLEQLAWLKSCTDIRLVNFFNKSGKVFLSSMPEVIKNKLICKLAFKEAA